MDGHPVLRKLFWSRVKYSTSLDSGRCMGSELKETKGKGGKGMKRQEESDPKISPTIH